MINYQVLKPRQEQLMPYIDSYVYISGEKAISKQIFPQVGASLVIDFNNNTVFEGQVMKMALIGLHQKSYRLQTHSSANDRIIIRFSPFGFHAFSSVSACEVTNLFVDAADIFGRSIRQLYLDLESIVGFNHRIGRIEEFLLKNIREHTLTDRMIYDFANRIKQLSDLSPFSAREKYVHLSSRQLERKFKSIVGTTISGYWKIVRFNRALHLLKQSTPKRLTDIAFECGYYDQSHFITDFKLLTGTSPRHYNFCS